MATYARVFRAQAEVARLEERTWTGVVIALAAALALALVATAVIAFRITRSVRHLSEATAAVAAALVPLSRSPSAVGTSWACWPGRSMPWRRGCGSSTR